VLSPEEEKYSYYNDNGHQGNQGKKEKDKKKIKVRWASSNACMFKARLRFGANQHFVT
jgi:hypothetical protein